MAKHWQNNGINVTIRKNESGEELIKRFKKAVIKDGIIMEVRKKMFFEKKSDKKRKEQIYNTNRLKKLWEKIEKAEEKNG